MFILKSDSSFIYTFLGRSEDDDPLTFDSSGGKFKLHGDTLHLNYSYNLHYPYLNDNPSDSLRWKIVNPYGYFDNRPQKMLWQGKKLHYIYDKTGQVEWNRDYVFSWGRGIAYYLYSRWYGDQILPGTGY